MKSDNMNSLFTISLDKCQCPIELFPVKKCKERFHVWHNTKPTIDKNNIIYVLAENAIIFYSYDLAKQWKELEGYPINWKIKALGLVKGEKIKSGYIGHCDSCDVMLESEELIESLLLKYDKKKVSEILNYVIYNLENESKER